MTSPFISSSVALPNPTSRGRKYVAPMSAPVSPTRTNTKPKRARSDAMRMSLARAVQHPPPAATPFTLAMTGMGNSRIARM